MKLIMKGQPFAPDKYEGWHVLTPAQDTQPVTVALPRWLITDHAYARTPEALREFRAFLVDFTAENRATFRAKRVVINLYDAPRPLPFDYVKVIQEVFREVAEDRIVDQVVVYTSLLH